MAIFPPLDTAKRALLTQEAALGVVGNNIANVNTPGYSRQVVDLQADPTIVAGGVRIGSGVHIASIRQVVDPLLLRRQLRAAADGGQQGAVSDSLSELTNIANDLTDPSLTSLIGGFFDAADALARNPAGLPERQGLLGAASALAGELNRRSDAIATLQRSADDKLVTLAGQANDDLAKIAALNRTIVATEVGGQPANDLRDRRQAALNDLSSLIGVSTLDEPGGSVAVVAADGTTLVSGATVVHGITTRAAGTGLDGLTLHEAGLTGPGGSFLSVPRAVASGALAGLAAVRDGDLVTASSNLDTFATTLRDAVNAVQTDPAAVDLNGLGTTASPLFSGTGAGDLAVALGDPTRIGAGLSTAPGDNQNALRLADLRSAPQAALANVTFGGYEAAEVSRIGESAAQSSTIAGASQALAQHLEQQRLSLSGVNLNEELTNMLQYQHAFQAAAQVINVSNQVLDSLLQII